MDSQLLIICLLTAGINLIGSRATLFANNRITELRCELR